MRHYLKACAVFLVLLIATACTGPTWQLSDYDVSSVRSVGIVSLLGETLEANYVGVWAFGNEYWESGKLGWNLNAMSVATVEKYLAGQGFTVIPLSYDRASMWKEYLEGQGSYGFRLTEFSSTFGLIEPELVRLSQSTDLDAFLVLTPGHEGRHCPGGEPCIGYGDRGYGVHNRLGIQHNAYISVMVSLVSAKDLKIMANVPANQHWPLSFKRWAASLDGYSEQERAEIRAAFEELAASGLREAVGHLGI
ncbi:MAG: hypothetical protein OEU09_09325 [Rhodospirillales bacterium]|nr:hypothetical protein [Rhodospirillales bacterium]MDH3911486.1 hypothetical protein [Rhodospirillales bacterium]